MIELQDVRKKYGERLVLDGISAQIGRGEVVSLVGPSGGGKTTLLRCLNGLEGFDAGRIRIDDQWLEPGLFSVDAPALCKARQRVGFVFQQWHLFAHRTALGNVMEAPVQVKRVHPNVAREQARALLAKVGLSHREHAYPAEMSGGEQQRVAIARALAMEPSALLMDEPTSALDPERVKGVRDLLTGLASEGLTIVMVTHEMRFARECSSSVLVLHGGHVVERGSPSEVLGKPKDPRTRAFLGLDEGAPE